MKRLMRLEKSNKENKEDRKLKKCFDGAEEVEEIMDRNEMKRLTEFIDTTNKLSGIVLKKAELENNFQKVYSVAIRKLVEFQFLGDGEQLLNNEIFLEIFGETGS